MRRIDELFLKYPFQSELVRQSRKGEGLDQHALIHAVVVFKPLAIRLR